MNENVNIHGQGFVALNCGSIFIHLKNKKKQGKHANFHTTCTDTKTQTIYSRMYL